jgi:hypothetical protein
MPGPCQEGGKRERGNSFFLLICFQANSSPSLTDSLLLHPSFSLALLPERDWGDSWGGISLERETEREREGERERKRARKRERERERGRERERERERERKRLRKKEKYGRLKVIGEKAKQRGKKLDMAKKIVSAWSFCRYRAVIAVNVQHPLPFPESVLKETLLLPLRTIAWEGRKEGRRRKWSFQYDGWNFEKIL